MADGHRPQGGGVYQPDAPRPLNATYRILYISPKIFISYKKNLFLSWDTYDQNQNAQSVVNAPPPYSLWLFMVWLWRPSPSLLHRPVASVRIARSWSPAKSIDELFIAWLWRSCLLSTIFYIYIYLPSRTLAIFS